MDPLILARMQFGITTVYHFFFVPLTLGLSVLVAVMETLYVRTGKESYKRMTKFWGKLFIINFAMGVVTGIVQEFQFGMNWSEYSRFVGDIFGAPLAIEALMAFFIESTFLGLWLFGWDKLPKGIHLACIWLVALASNLSSLWILIANSFMQNPVGYEIVDGRAQMTDFVALITNRNIFYQFPHVVLAGFATGGFFLIGVSAYRLLKATDETEKTMFQRSATLGMVFGLVAIFSTLFAGHASGQNTAVIQPMKLAAAEGLWESEDPAGLSIFQIGDENKRETIVDIRIPRMLSFLTFNSFSGEVQGMNPLNAQYQEQYADKYGPDADYVPPMIWLTYWSFRVMVGIGTVMTGLAAYGLWLKRKGTLLETHWYLKLMLLVVALPFVANATGWLLTEMGRQPWIVYGLMRIEEAVSPNVTTTMLAISLVGFALIYGVLAVVDVYLLQKFARTYNGEDEEAALSHTVQDAPSDAGAY